MKWIVFDETDSLNGGACSYAPLQMWLVYGWDEETQRYNYGFIVPNDQNWYDEAEDEWSDLIHDISQNPFAFKKIPDDVSGIEVDGGLLSKDIAKDNHALVQAYLFILANKLFNDVKN
jgi:hypothetical protein